MSDQDTKVTDEDVDFDDTTAPAAREAQLRIRKFDPWSVFRTAFVLSIALGIVFTIANLIIWMVLTLFGVFSSVNDVIESVAGTSSSILNVEDVFSFWRVLVASVVGAIINIVWITFIATLFAILYNAVVPFSRGIRVTLGEDK